MKGAIVDKHFEIEDIEWMRRQAGINDVELWSAIRALRPGDHVRLTFVADSTSHATETLRVRLTRVRGSEFRGKLADQPNFHALSGLHLGSAIPFTASHIHSVILKARSPQTNSPRIPVLRSMSRV